MAGFGAKYIKFNPIEAQPKGKLPTYKKDGAVQVGRLCKADLSVQMASGKLYADDELAESMDEFSYGTLAVETDDMLDEVASVVYGCAVEGKLVRYRYGDQPPEGGLAYVKGLIRRGGKSYKGVFFPRTKAALGNESAQSRGDSITFGTSNTSFTIMTCESGDWKQTEEFATEAEAKAWVNEKLNSTADGDAPEDEALSGAAG